MEMHSRQSLSDVHGVSSRDQARLRRLWIVGMLALVSRAKLALKSELKARRAATELARMDDRMLRDIGISRSEIERVVRRSTTRAWPTSPTNS
jgi:uncharacterized protein YjiS (DUF1127 family)